MRNALLLHYDFYGLFGIMSDEDIGKVIRAAFEYDMNNTMPEFNDKFLLSCFLQLKTFIDRNNTHYENVCKKRSETAKRNWERLKEQNVTN